MLTLGAGTAHATTLAATATAVTIGYTLPSTPAAAVTDTLTATTASTFFNVVTSTVPGWLTVTQTGTTSVGTTSTATVSFVANATAGAMLPGTYSASVQFTSAMSTNPTIVVTLAIKSAPAKFTAITSNATQTWNPGSASGITVSIACSSNGEPISFAVTLGGQMKRAAMTATPASGIALFVGHHCLRLISRFPICCPASRWARRSTGIVTLTPNNSAAATVININVNINPPAANITGLQHHRSFRWIWQMTTPSSSRARASPRGVTSVQAKVASGSYATLDASHITITGPTSMVVTLDHGTYLTAAHSILIQAENSATSWLPSTPLALASVTTPIIYSVTNAASFTEPVTGTNPTVAPYEIISIFGANFDPANGLVNNTSETAAPGIFGTTVNNSKGRAVIVYFCLGNLAATNCTGGDSSAFLAKAPLIFVSNNQINAVVPVEIEGISNASLGTNSATLGANVLVSVAAVTNDAANQFLLNTAVSAPGVFTPDGTGRGSAAVLNHDWTLNTASNPNPKGTVFHIYMTGVGDPPSTGADTAAATPAAPATCVSTANYLALLAGATTGPTTAAGNSAGRHRHYRLKRGHRHPRWRRHRQRQPLDRRLPALLHHRNQRGRPGHARHQHHAARSQLRRLCR